MTEEFSRPAPLVTICLPVRNGAKTVRETLDSLAAQTVPNLEIVLSVNVSTGRRHR